MAIMTTTKEIGAAIRKSKAETQNEITVKKAAYHQGLDAVVLYLSNETRKILPREQLQGLREASRSKVANIEILGRGTGLHWPDLDVDLSTDGLLSDVYGTKQWMSELGRTGGSSRSKAKAEAARRNGAKGGRPSVNVRRENPKAWAGAKAR